MLGVPRTSRYNLVVGKEVEQTQRFHTVKFISASDLFASPLVFGLIVVHGTKTRTPGCTAAVSIRLTGRRWVHYS